MENFKLLAEPWWVNIFFFLPFAVYYFWRNGLRLKKSILLLSAIFGIFFGFVEAAVVVYLRASLGLLSGYGGTLADTAQILSQLPERLLIVELFREAATIIMLLSVAFLAVKAFKERCAVFFWAFAAWDIFYYVGLWLAVRWPGSLTTPDVLFLIPVPWYSQVWFPILVSGLLMLAVILRVDKYLIRK